MSPSETQDTAGDPAADMGHELANFRDRWWWFLLLGVLIVLCGVVAIVYPFVSAVAVVMVLGATLLISGVATIVTSFWTGKWSAFLIQLLIGIMYTVIGYLVLDAPADAIAALTLLVAGVFVVVGIFRMASAIAIQYPQWGWVLLNGAVVLIIGLLIYRQYPQVATYLIGTLFGIDLLFGGWMWIMLSIQIRNLKVLEEPAAQAA